MFRGLKKASCANVELLLHREFFNSLKSSYVYIQFLHEFVVLVQNMEDCFVPCSHKVPAEWLRVGV